MLRSGRSPLLDRVPYATLFRHNKVLQRVFEAPADKVALSVELPETAKVDYTYGRLQQDLVSMADALVARREAVARARGEAPLSWVQPSKPPHVRSVYAQGERTPSCDHMKDTGFYTASLMCGPGYPFVVSLLACWATNQLATPMSVSQRYDDELMYVLDHSGSRIIIGETPLLKEKFPAQYEPLYVRALADIDRISTEARRVGSGGHTQVTANTFLVDSVLDAEQLLRVNLSEPHMRASMGVAVPVDALPELLGPAEDGCAPLETAEDVVARIDRERAAAKERELRRLEAMLEADHKRRNAVPDEPAASGLCYDTDHLERLNPLFRRWHTDKGACPRAYDDCLMIYTSGTTARPKGAVHTHASVANMVEVLQRAWEWSSEDCILNMLPVHHVHGLVNVLLCSLASNARCVFAKFGDPVLTAKRLGRGDITLFMGVPTMYTKLIAGISRGFSPVEKTAFRNACSQSIRLMVCGSAALPVPTLNQFRDISGHTLLERYGMTEIGMAVSQPLRPIAERVPGTVGSPLPTVDAFVYHPKEADQESTATTPHALQEKQYDDIGALAIASASLFDRYWNNPAATKKELRTNEVGQRFFDTGDTVGVSVPKEQGKPAVFTILGRSSIDIIKSRGYKLSALEIEAALLSRKDLFYEVAVVGAKDETRGEKAVAVIAMQPEAAKARRLHFDGSAKCVETDALTEEMTKVSLEVLAPYKCPKRFLFVPEIPRNPTGKVNKKHLKQVLSVE